MTHYLITLSVGPVQGFIASARRSRDLWSGSWLLSELSKACAKNLKDNGATLIFPFIENDADLAKNSDFSVGNKIQAIIQTENLDSLQDIIKTAKQATCDRFNEEVDNAKTALDKYQDQIRQNIWDSQIQDYVEIQVAWATINGENGYQNAVQKVARVLASRKATRDFSPSATTPYQSERMIPKSSLDGMRETILKESLDEKGRTKELPDGLRKKLSLSSSEQLDVSGVVKRLGFGEKAEQFTPITRVTADAWIQQIPDDEIQSIINLYEKLYDDELATKVTGNDKIYQKFPYDAQLLYPSRLEKAIQDYPNNQNLKNLQKHLKQNFWSNKQYGEPYRYGVLLLADGDRMGELLDKATNQQQHQAITQALSTFAGKVATTMRKSRGHCIYAGGDDVLGFVPLDTAYQCANDLQKLFAKSLEQVANDLEATIPTLSVGLAICHIMTPLSVIRELASQAEKHAKGDHVEDKDKRRNALGIVLSVRSGTDTLLRYRWDDTDGIKMLNKLIGYYNDKSIPSRVAYDIRAIHLQTCDYGKNNEKDPDLHKKIQSAEMTRMLKQARTDKGEKIDSDIIKELTQRGEMIGLDALADELIVARWFAAKTQKDLGKE